MDTTILQDKPVAPPAAVLNQAAIVLENGIAANDAQRFLLANRTPEQDCLLDDYRAIRPALQAAGLDADALLVGFVTRIRQISELNNHERTGQHAVRGTLTQLVEAGGTMQAALSIRGLRASLVGPLAVLSDAEASRADLFQALRDIDHALRGVPRDRIVNGSLRAQLGAGPHDLLLTLITTQVTA